MKLCPKCNTQHSKKGTFCSKSCANSRSWSENDNLSRSLKLKQFFASSEGQKCAEKTSNRMRGKIHSNEIKNKIKNSVMNYWTEEKRLEASKKQMGKKVSQETRDKLSVIAKKRNLGGHTSKQKLFFCKKSGEVVYLQSSYEIAFANLLEEMDIEWERPAPLLWIDKQQKEHKYYPDFKIGNKFFDTKNDYLALKDREKIDLVSKQNNVSITVVLKENINKNFIASVV